MAASGRLHADARILHGFSLRAVLAEFRALRATVLRLYESSGESDLGEVRRFNESIDEALTDSMNRYAARTDAFRDQFVGILSHDLRNPLGAITTGAALSGGARRQSSATGASGRAHPQQLSADGPDDRRSARPDPGQAGRRDSPDPGHAPTCSTSAKR